MLEPALLLIEENKRSQNPRLDLGRCALHKIPDKLFDCVWLEELILSNQWWDDEKNAWISSANDSGANNISTIPHSIAKLQKLKTFIIGGTSFNPWDIKDIEPLQLLLNLEYLDISCNQILDISPLSYLKNLQYLNIKNNKISIPVHVLNQGTKFTAQYIKSLKKEALNECKVIITGRGGVGKTSLQKRLFGSENFDPVEQETHGIRKKTWHDGVKSVDNNYIKVHFWDMGGQQEQQTLHQLFYTENAIYILLLDKRLDEDPENFLELIKVYGNSCPVIIAINNKIDLRQNHNIKYNLSPEFDSTIRDKYRNVRKVFGVCCGQENDPGINELKRYLIDFIPTLDHVREKYPVEWLEIKDDLLTKINRNFIKFDEFEVLCESKNLFASHLQVGLAKMLNNTGAITYFDKPYLHYYILNPDWVTTGIYEITLSPITAKNKGQITFNDLPTIFQQKLIYRYNTSDYEFLMKLMLAYNLCHEFRAGQEWLVPSSLKGQPNTNLIKYKENGDYRLYCLKYRTALPQSIIHKFIAINIVYAYMGDYWRNGIVLKHRDTDTYLFTEADYKEKEIRIWIKGKEVLEAWKFFRKDFIDLSQRFDYEEMVEIESEQKAMMSYKEIVNLYKNLPKHQLENWYNPNLNVRVDILKALALFQDDVQLINTSSGHETMNAVKESNGDEKKSETNESKVDLENKELQFKINALEKERENFLIKKWKRKSVYTLIISIILTFLLFIIYIKGFSFIMSTESWRIFKESDYFKWIGLALAFAWNSIIGKMFYDRVFDPSKEKAYRDDLKNKNLTL